MMEITQIKKTAKEENQDVNLDKELFTEFKDFCILKVSALQEQQAKEIITLDNRYINAKERLTAEYQSQVNTLSRQHQNDLEMTAQKYEEKIKKAMDNAKKLERII